ncbi:hypothetical protein JW998_04960, partial [candidate division KSB1 bacterium]|nr:hypothetical protein [candidate division KSB1 bacterium]
ENDPKDGFACHVALTVVVIDVHAALFANLKKSLTRKPGAASGRNQKYPNHRVHRDRRENK